MANCLTRLTLIMMQYTMKYFVISSIPEEGWYWLCLIFRVYILSRLDHWSSDPTYTGRIIVHICLLPFLIILLSDINWYICRIKWEQNDVKWRIGYRRCVCKLYTQAIAKKSENISGFESLQRDWRMMGNRFFSISSISDVINRSFIAWRFLIWEMSCITVVGTLAVGQWKISLIDQIPWSVQGVFFILQGRGWVLGGNVMSFMFISDQFSTFKSI